jgi:hypothetical protein
VNVAARFAYGRLRSFRREGGAPYDQYVWVYSRVYGMAMRALHRCGRHWFRQRPLGGRHCDWCGARG